MSKLGVGVVGVGDMGRRHAENIRSLVPQRPTGGHGRSRHGAGETRRQRTGNRGLLSQHRRVARAQRH